MQVTKPEETKFEKKTLEDGSYAARIYSMVDQGTHKSVFPNDDGSDKFSRDINISFEVPSELIEYEKDGEQVKYPHAVHKNYPRTLHEKSGLTELVKAALGKVDDSVDLNNLLGKEVLITVGKTSGGNDKITAVTALPKGMTVDKAVNPVKVFDLDAFDQTVFDALPEWQRTKIAESPEHKALGGNVDLADELEADTNPF